MAEKNADLVIINTCSVTITAIAKSRQTAGKAKKENPGAKIAVLGCWPTVNKKDAANLKADYVYGAGKHDEFIKRVVSDFKPEQSGDLRVEGCESRDKSRYFIKIQDGCEQFCSYCIIPYARGRMKSRGEEDVLDEIKGAVKRGHEEIILSGIHLGLYGREAGNNLSGLLKKILLIKNLGRVRLSSIEVNEVTDEIIGLLAQKRKEGTAYVCRHLHIPLQSGCDKILKLMNRPYDTAYFRSKVRKLQSLMPEIAITTDIITGFPGETEEDFKTTYDFVKEINFSRLHVFPFSAHERTPAARMKDPVGDETKKMRAEKLRRLGHKLAREYRNKFAGRKLFVAVGNVKNGRCLGKSEYYFDIELDLNKIKKNARGDLTGRIITVKV